jgi:hypothetical protein
LICHFIFAILRLIFLSLFISTLPPCSDAASFSAFSRCVISAAGHFASRRRRHAASAHVALIAPRPRVADARYRRQRRSRFFAVLKRTDVARLTSAAFSAD